MRRLDEYNATLEELADDLLPEVSGEPLTRDELLSEATYSHILSCDGIERRDLLDGYREHARKLRCKREFEEGLKRYATDLFDIEQIGFEAGKSHFPAGKPQINVGKWKADRDGVYTCHADNNGNIVKEYASTIPIMPTALLTNAETGTEKIALTFHKGGQWRTAVFDRSIVASAAKIVQTADQGTEANSETARLLVKYIADCVKENDIESLYSISRLGWNGDEFAPYSAKLIVDSESEYHDIYECFHSKGDFEEWKRYVKKLRKNNIPLRLVMGAAVISPYLQKLNLLPFIVHLWGGSGSGKSVSLITAMSIWGKPTMGDLVRGLNGTANSIANTAAFMCNMPCAFDELQTIKDSTGNYDKLIMSLCQGAERGRMKGDKLATSKKWHCAFLFTGEDPIIKNSSGGGAVNRVIEVDCHDRKIVANGNEVVAFLEHHYGHAGKVIVDYMTEHSEDIRALYDKVSEALLGGDTTDKQALAMAAIVVGDAIASTCLFEGETALTSDDVREFMKTKAEVDIAARAFDYIKDIIAVNDNHFYANSYGDIPGEIWGEVKVSRTKISEKQVKITHVVVINKTKLVELLQEKGYDFEAVKRRWFSDAKLEIASGSRYVHTDTIHGKKQNCVRLIISTEISDIQTSEN